MLQKLHFTILNNNPSFKNTARPQNDKFRNQLKLKKKTSEIFKRNWLNYSKEKLCSKSLEVQIHWNFEDISFRLKGLTCFDVSNSTLLFYARSFKKFDC